MARSTAEVCDHLDRVIRAYSAAAAAVDGAAIHHVLGGHGPGGNIDERTAAFLRQAHRCVLATTMALSAVLDAHRGQLIRTGETVCRECGTVGRPCRTLSRISSTLALYGLGEPPFEGDEEMP